MRAFVRERVGFGDKHDLERGREVLVPQGKGIRLDHKATFANDRNARVER